MKELQKKVRLKNLPKFLKEYEFVFKDWADKQKVKLEDVMLEVTIKQPFKRRSTGAFSQNHCLNGYLAQICEYTGQDFKTTKEYMKTLAIERGYPRLTREVWRNGEKVIEDCKDWNGNLRGISESDCSVEDCAILIETTVQFAVEELGLVLKDE